MVSFMMTDLWMEKFYTDLVAYLTLLFLILKADTRLPKEVVIPKTLITHQYSNYDYSNNTFFAIFMQTFIWLRQCFN